MANASAFDAMDRMYRMQRYFYDLTRKYYLLGRDRLLREMHVRSGERILEVGCGTARNLIILSRNSPGAKLFGLDASSAMLETAATKANAAGAEITLKTALADDFTFDETFELEEKFDKVFFSYSISMIPPWRESILNAIENLKPGGELFIVDFYDQKALPTPFRKALQRWLLAFHVKYPAELVPYLESLDQKGIGKLTVTPLHRRYAILAALKKK
jgi:S-adenosylmethionine-diacylgycerolhomoserine-N-methlytransferase